MEKNAFQNFLKENFPRLAANHARGESPVSFSPDGQRAIAMLGEIANPIPLSVDVRAIAAVPVEVGPGSAFDISISVDGVSHDAPARPLTADLVRLAGLNAADLAKLISPLPSGPVKFGNWEGRSRA